MRLNWYLLGSTLVAALGGFLFGFDTAVISGTENALRAVFRLDSGQWGFTVASALIGTIVGSLIVGRPAERLGRKPVLVGLAILYFVSALGCGFAMNWPILIAFRFIGGLAIGGASVVSPMYIAEISPPEVRGRLVATSQLNIVAGILVAYASNYAITALVGGPQSEAWRWMLGILAVPSVLFFFALAPIPESPRWLVKEHKRDEALAVLRRLGNDDPERLVGEIVESLHEERVAASEPFFQWKYRVPIGLALIVATFNQLSGINALIYYTPHIFQMAGASADTALLQSVGFGFTNLLFTIIAMTVIDQFGRKKLLLIGAAGLTVCLAVVAHALWHGSGVALVMTALIGYVAFFAFSQGSVIWVYLSEIFPNRVRARGQALGSFTHWFWAAVVGQVFPMIVGPAVATEGSPLSRSGQAAPFIFFALMMALQFVVVWRFLPETKGVSLEQIQKKLGIE
jgi:sugar porter (SP) family MFS transporter